MDPGPTISHPYTRHKWVGRMICSQANVSALAQDPLRLPESMTMIKNRTDTLRFSFPLMNTTSNKSPIKRLIIYESLPVYDSDSNQFVGRQHREYFPTQIHPSTPFKLYLTDLFRGPPDHLRVMTGCWNNIVNKC
jgi:hypothetical protein